MEVNRLGMALKQGGKFACDCGMSFGSQEDMKAHAKKAHKM
jgi:hypothetical protein